MKDLLPSVTGVPHDDGDSGDVEKGKRLVRASEASSSPQSPEMEAFFQAVSEIKHMLAHIKEQQENLKGMHEKSKASTRMEDTKRFAVDMRDVVDDVGSTATHAKKQLEALDRLNREATGVPGNEVGSSNERIRSAVSMGLKKKLRDLMSEMGSLRQRIQKENREAVGRRLYTVTGAKASEDEIEEFVETGRSSNIYQQAVMEGRGHILDTLAEIQERHAAVEQLEKSLWELRQVFLDMAVLVESQGAMLDSIEAQVAKSVEYVAKGTEQLVQARDLQRSSQKWMCASLVCLIILVVIIIVSICTTGLCGI